MKNYANTNIRNILVAGHAGCGKTTLVEALLYTTGALERMGRVEDGNTVSDFVPESGGGSRGVRRREAEFPGHAGPVRL